jgi:Mrp family chromosome partitioning ATPase
VNTEYAVANSAFLVGEKLAYVPRFGLHEAIVKMFETRQAMRCKHKTSGMDKALNQLMVLTATSGAGKSTELVQFPQALHIGRMPRPRALCR